jgi:hypothetical protein
MVGVFVSSGSLGRKSLEYFLSFWVIFSTKGERYRQKSRYRQNDAGTTLSSRDIFVPDRPREQNCPHETELSPRDNIVPFVSWGLVTFLSLIVPTGSILSLLSPGDNFDSGDNIVPGGKISSTGGKSCKIKTISLQYLYLYTCGQNRFISRVCSHNTVHSSASNVSRLTAKIPNRDHDAVLFKGSTGPSAKEAQALLHTRVSI